ncbi:DUF7594 domain-containing protein [Cystobacter fuscus]
MCVWVVGAGVCGWGGQGSAAPGQTALAAESEQNSWVLAPVADARVEGPAATQNFGGSSVLKVDGSPRYESFLRFELQGLTGTVLGAKLRLYATDATVNGPAVYTTDETWREGSVTYETRPGNQTWVASAGPVAANSWVEWDVTSAVQGKSTVSFSLSPTGTDGTVFNSRESPSTESRPQLVVTVDGGTAPTQGGWTFYGSAEGLPSRVLGVSADAGGNLWVAGGEDGLFVLEKGQTRFRRFTMEDGLRPYGYMLDGSAPPGTKYLNVISVAGGPAGVAFVGYGGKAPAAGMPTCEDEWDAAPSSGRTPDASIYKSGDADRVTLSGSGIQVVHYDISSGPNMVAAEPRGREKLCHILRIAYDPKTRGVWFGANHGFAWGNADFTGYSCAPGTWNYGCAGVMEHVHPAINGWNASRTGIVLLTDAYHGVSVTPNGDVWFGGAIRSTRFRYGTLGYNYWSAQVQTEGGAYSANRLDVWPDAVSEPTIPTREQRVDDNVSGMAVMGDQSVWVGSFTRGLALLDSNGQRLRTLSTELVDGAGRVSAVAADPSDESVWAGASWGEGLSRVRGGEVLLYGESVLPSFVHWLPVKDIQVDRSGPQRRILVAFDGTQSKPGAVGVYTGP